MDNYIIADEHHIYEISNWIDNKLTEYNGKSCSIRIFKPATLKQDIHMHLGIYTNRNFFPITLIFRLKPGSNMVALADYIHENIAYINEYRYSNYEIELRGEIDE